MYKFFTAISLTFAALLISVESSRATTYTIEAIDSSFTPDSLSILVGDTVIWTWISGNHTITSNGIPAGAAPWNELLDSFHPSFTYVALIPGEYQYLSIPDLPDMQGEFIVTYPIGISTPLAASLNFLITPSLVHDLISLNFEIPFTDDVTIYIYNQPGSWVKQLLSGRLEPGKHEMTFYLNDQLAPGMYIVTLEYLNAQVARKVVVW